MKLNCDMGEGLASDADVMPYLQQASIACGGHAGDKGTMTHTVQLAKKSDVSIGAHPSYPDRENFGRRSINIKPEQLFKSIITQLSDLHEVCMEHNAHIRYIKPHGALNNDMVINDGLFSLICRASKEFAEELPIMVQMTSRKAQMSKIAEEYGTEIIWEIFADRAYEEDGTLRSRRHTDAVHQNPQHIIDQVAEIAQNYRIPIHDSTNYYSIIGASSICIHGDNAASVAACPQIAEILNRQE